MPNKDAKTSKNRRWQRFIWWPRLEENNLVENTTFNLLQKIKESANSHLGKWQRKLPDTCPWYLVIGPNLSGKTTAIMQAGYEPIAPNKQQPPTPTNTESIDAWYGNNHLLLDSSGRIFNENDKPAQTLAEQLPQALQKQPRPWWNRWPGSNAKHSRPVPKHGPIRQNGKKNCKHL